MLSSHHLGQEIFIKFRGIIFATIEVIVGLWAVNSGCVKIAWFQYHVVLYYQSSWHLLLCHKYRGWSGCTMLMGLFHPSQLWLLEHLKRPWTWNVWMWKIVSVWLYYHVGWAVILGCFTSIDVLWRLSGCTKVPDCTISHLDAIQGNYHDTVRQWMINIVAWKCLVILQYCHAQLAIRLQYYGSCHPNCDIIVFACSSIINYNLAR